MARHALINDTPPTWTPEARRVSYETLLRWWWNTGWVGLLARGDQRAFGWSGHVIPSHRAER